MLSKLTKCTTFWTKSVILKKAYHGFNDITVSAVIPFTIHQYLNIKRRVIPEVVIIVVQWANVF